MSELKGACIIGQSGGPTSVINASAYGVIRTALDSGCITNVYGAEHGIKGVLEDRLFDMSQEDPKELELLKYTPSSALGSCRYKMKDPDEDDTDYKRILEVFKKHDVRYFFYNGGNDSMDTCNKISKYMQKVGYECRVMGVPKTIDNDLYGTDHCPGYASAAKYIATSLMEVYQDAHVYDTGMICIVEIMGRHAGWLTAAAALATKYGAGPDLIYLPETDFDMDTFLADVQRVYKETGSCMVAVSEGIHYADGSFVSEAKTSATDGFGHAQLGGLAALLASIVKEKTGAKVRGIELSLLQRCGAHLASETDIEEAVMAGRAAVENAVAGITDKMVAFERETVDGHYVCKTKLLPLTEVANFEKKIPIEWINDSHNGVKQEFIDYVLVHAFRLFRGPLTENIRSERQRRFLRAAFRVERQRNGIVLCVIGLRPRGHAEGRTQARKLRVRLIPVDLTALRAPLRGVPTVDKNTRHTVAKGAARNEFAAPISREIKRPRAVALRRIIKVIANGPSRIDKALLRQRIEVTNCHNCALDRFKLEARKAEHIVPCGEGDFFGSVAIPDPSAAIHAERYVDLRTVRAKERVARIASLIRLVDSQRDGLITDLLGLREQHGGRVSLLRWQFLYDGLRSAAC